MTTTETAAERPTYTWTDHFPQLEELVPGIDLLPGYRYCICKPDEVPDAQNSTGGFDQTFPTILPTDGPMKLTNSTNGKEVTFFVLRGGKRVPGGLPHTSLCPFFVSTGLADEIGFPLEGDNKEESHGAQIQPEGSPSTGQGSQGHARVQGGSAQERKRQEGDKPQAGNSDRSQRSSPSQASA